jgi:RNA polymerase sigma factor (TIGR02999 family)
MKSTDSNKITALLKAWSNGETNAESELMPLVYNELRRLARHYRRRAGSGETLQTTALVHEAYLRLVKIDGVTWLDRVHFFAVSAQLMRRILVDAARADHAVKRGGAVRKAQIPDLDAIPAPGSDRSAEVIALDDALRRLSEFDPRRARIIELRVFGGLSHEESAAVLGISPDTARRDWRLAKAWIFRELSRSEADLSSQR